MWQKYRISLQPDYLLICSKSKYELSSASKHCLCIAQPLYLQPPFTVKVISSKQVLDVPPIDGNSIATEPAYHDKLADIEPDSPVYESHLVPVGA